MNAIKHTAGAWLISLAAGTAPAIAQTNTAPWVDMESTSVMVGIGGQKGDGQLNLPNLGSNCVYPFKVGGFGAGIQVGVTKIAASGPVKNLTRLDDFPGTYSATQGLDATVVAGSGTISMKNNANNVSIDLASKTTGLSLGIAGQRLTIEMPIPPANAPRAYVLEFGFNKNWVNADSRKKLNELVNSWKCRFVNMSVVGHTDTTGKESDNLNLSELRAIAVQDYLSGAGVAPGRIKRDVAGERDLQVQTVNGVRLRNNRVVVVTIQ
jgi:outer membrane protein OmpA-like peptidoglycan-associated protein